MDPKELPFLNFLLFLSLTFELSCGTGESSMDCPVIPGQLGSSVLLPLTSEGIRNTNKSIHIIVTMAKSQGENIKKKIVSLDLPKKVSPHYVENGYKFHLENLSLGILESKKEDEGWYFMTLEENVSVQHFCLQLSLYEQISTPEIKVLNWTQENGNCSLMLACMVEKGDKVAYNWFEKTNTHPLSPANDSAILYLTLGPQHANSIYSCTASNPISNRSRTFTPWSQCKSHSPGKADHYQPTVEAKSLTIYAQVQKSGSVQKKPDSLPAQDSCTTIYVAATEPVPEPIQEPSSVTVYASVTLPES
ncbi:signaling lymphocytic activation molecule isoform X2 [Pteropus vampyrus]|uniref:Signaling lymphocytic activation molecule isoform X2 n=1 Tax=Pteropus vampyrus TaxID=132908 RepID=A0A6P3RBK2_PTEVA|nr:signaling lymphocytic activation molecule isoform X2 [Pteropus vampyrus]